MAAFIQISPLKEIIAIALGNKVEIFDSFPSKDQRARHEIQHGQPVQKIQFSKCGKFIASCCAAKSLKIHQVLEDRIELVRERSVPKKLNGIAFTLDSTRVLIADKFGDIYEWEFQSQEDSEGALKLLGGHVSMITELLLAKEDHFMITSDRDEKIRITNYPRTQVIHRFLFGHREFISALCMPADNVLVSGGGDEDLFFWTLGKDSRLLQRAPLLQEIQKQHPEFNGGDLAVRSIVNGDQWMAVIVDGLSFIFFLVKKNDECWEFVHAHEMPAYPVSLASSKGDLYVTAVQAEEDTVKSSVVYQLKVDMKEKSVELHAEFTLTSEESQSPSLADIFQTNNLRKDPSDHQMAGKKMKYERAEEKEKLKKAKLEMTSDVAAEDQQETTQ